MPTFIDQFSTIAADVDSSRPCDGLVSDVCADTICVLGALVFVVDALVLGLSLGHLVYWVLSPGLEHASTMFARASHGLISAGLVLYRLIAHVTGDGAI